MNTEQKCCPIHDDTHFCRYKIPGHPNSNCQCVCTCSHTEQKGWRESFDKEFLTRPSNRTHSGLQLDCDPEFAKAFIERTLQSYQEELVNRIEELVPRLNNIPTSHKKTAQYSASSTKQQILSLIKDKI